jgi:choline dehydrogenase-like flavoprotein
MGIDVGRHMPSEVSVDICIFGAGPGGLTVASNFLDKAHSVALIESGSMENGATASDSGEISATGYPYAPLSTCRLRGFGGSTQLLGWGGLCKPLDAQDFQARAWVRNSGWPFEITHLTPYYERASKTLGLRQLEAISGRRESFPEGASLLSIDNLELCEHYRLGHHLKPAMKRSESVRVLTLAKLLYLEFGEDGRSVAYAVCVDSAGERFHVRSKFFVLAAGGIENPRILLLSYRLAQRSTGLIGKYFMDHPRYTIGTLTPANGDIRAMLAGFDRIRIARRQRIANVLGISSDKGYLVRGFTLGFEAQKQHQLLNYRAWVEPHYTGQDRQVLEDIKQSMLKSRDSMIISGKKYRWALMQGDHLGWTKGMHLVRPAILARAFRLQHFPEPEPLSESMVSLSDTMDRHGLPLTRVSWQIAENTLLSLRKTIRLIQDETRLYGIGRLDVTEDEWENLERPMWTWHHMGTTRMHMDSSRGVVDADCRVHGVSNLFVAGSSVFPTAGNDTPTFTIVALAHRLADHLVRLLA